MKSSSSMGFDSGIATMNPLHGYQENGNHGFMANGTGERTSSVDVKFAIFFNSIPKIVVGLSLLDASGLVPGDSVRVNVYASNITQEGFTLNFTTWAGTHLWGASANWFAYSLN
jgi:hypothetical protein